MGRSCLFPHSCLEEQDRERGSLELLYIDTVALDHPVLESWVLPWTKWGVLDPKRPDCSTCPTFTFRRKWTGCGSELLSVWRRPRIHVQCWLPSMRLTWGEHFSPLALQALFWENSWTWTSPYLGLILKPTAEKSYYCVLLVDLHRMTHWFHFRIDCWYYAFLLCDLKTKPFRLIPESCDIW